MAEQSAHSSVLQASAPIPDSQVPVSGPNFDRPHSLDELLSAYATIGFQASSLGKAVDIVNEMVRRLDREVLTG